MLLKQKLFPPGSRRRLTVQYTRKLVEHGPKGAELFSPNNRFLARQFASFNIDCNICGKNSRLIYAPQFESERAAQKVSLLRENLRCSECGSWQRIRLLGHALISECNNRLDAGSISIEQLAGKLDRLDILDTDTFGTIGKMLRGPKYKVSDYRPDLPPGEMSNGAYNVDLQKIPFADGSFDIILSTDVFEHIRDPRLAHREVFRCLKPGGVHIFTVPFDRSAASTRPLIDTSSSKDIFLELPQIHGNSLTGGIVAYRIYGMDMLEMIRSAGFEVGMHAVSDAGHGIFSEIYFSARKPGNAI